MPPRRTQPQTQQEPTMEELMKEIQQLQNCLDEAEGRPRGTPPPVYLAKEEAEENPFHQEVSSDEKKIG